MIYSRSGGVEIPISNCVIIVKALFLVCSCHTIHSKKIIIQGVLKGCRINGLFSVIPTKNSIKGVLFSGHPVYVCASDVVL